MPEKWDRQQRLCENVKPGIVNVRSVFSFTFRKNGTVRRKMPSIMLRHVT
jgi:hypothetical protein